MNKKLELTDEEIIESSRVDMFLPNGELDPDCGYSRGRQQVAKKQLAKVADIIEADLPNKITHYTALRYIQDLVIALKGEIKDES